MIVERKKTPVLYLACADEVEEMRAAWERLEAVVPLKGRRFYGAAFGDGTYWVCVERLPGEERGELEEGELPGGAYRRDRLRGEPPAVYDRIAPAVEALGPGDPSRPVIEHYRRRDEIDVLVPV
jgi:hypothetical protein